LREGEEDREEGIELGNEIGEVLIYAWTGGTVENKFIL